MSSGSRTQNNRRPVGRFSVLREGAIQRGDGPNARQKRKPVVKRGGMLPREILKTRLSENAFCAF